MGAVNVAFLLGLVMSVSVNSVRSNEDIEISLDRQFIASDAPGICSTLTCGVKDNQMLVLGVKVSLVNSAGRQINLIKLSKAKSNINISKRDIRGNGTLSADEAVVVLELMDASYCQASFYFCEVFYKTKDGKKERQFAAAGPSHTPDLPELSNAVSPEESESVNITELINEAVTKSFDELLLKAIDAVQMVDTATRVSRLEEILLTQVLNVPTSCPTNQSDSEELDLEDLEKRVAALENPPKEVLECKRGMGDDVTKWYQPYVKVTDSATENPLLCDTHTDGGGWIVIQRRINGDEDFYRGWDDYRNGFGSIDGDFWIGNEFINTLTNENEYELRIDMKVDGKDEFAYSSNFSLTDEADSYRLKLGKVWGTVSAKGLEYQKDQQFTTFDVDHDTWPAGNCAEKFHGAWWYQACHHSNLNGAWNQTGPTGVAWISGGSWINPTFTEMKMRRVASLVLAE